MLITDTPTKRKAAINRWLERAKNSVYRCTPPGHRTILAKIHRILKVILGNEQHANCMIERAYLLESYNTPQRDEKGGVVYVLWSPRHIYCGKTTHLRQRWHEHMVAIKGAEEESSESQGIHRAIRRELISEEWHILPVRVYRSEFMALACEAKIISSLRTFKPCKNIRKCLSRDWETELPCLKAALDPKGRRNRPRRRPGPTSRIPDSFLVTPLKVATERVRTMSLNDVQQILGNPYEYTMNGYILLLKRIALPYERLSYMELEQNRECVFPILCLQNLAFQVLPHNKKLKTALRKIRYHSLKRGVPSITSINLTTRYLYERDYLGQMRRMVMSSSHEEIQYCLQRTRWSIQTTTKKRLLELATTCRRALKNGPPPPLQSRTEERQPLIQLHDMNSPLAALPFIPRQVLRESAKMLRSTRRNLIFPPDMRPFVNFRQDLAMKETPDWRAGTLLQICNESRCVIAPDDKHKHMAYLLPSVSYRSDAWNAMDDGTFIPTDLTEREALAKIAETSKVVKPPKKVPRTYFTIKQKCVRPCHSPLCTVEKATLVQNVCKKAPPHKCMRRIISTSGCYEKAEEKQQKSDGATIRRAVHTHWCTLACIPCESLIHQAYQKVLLSATGACRACRKPLRAPTIMTFDATSFFETVDEAQFLEAANELESLAPRTTLALDRTREIIRSHRFVKLLGRIWQMTPGKGSPIGMRCSGSASLITMGFDENRFYPTLWAKDWLAGLRYEDDLLTFSNLCHKCVQKVIAFAYRRPMDKEASNLEGKAVSWTSFVISQEKETLQLKVRPFLKPGWQAKVRKYDPGDVLYQKAYFLSMCHVGRITREHLRKGFPKRLIRRWFYKRHPRSSWKALEGDLSEEDDL